MVPAILVLALFAQFPSAVPQPQSDSPIRLTLRLADGRLQFGPGEIIPIDTRIMLWSINEPDESHIELAQYRYTSIAALEEKLS